MSIAPCKTCPWRTTTRTEDIPGGGLNHARRGAFVNDGRRLMQCHCSPDEDPTPCVGFVLQVGVESVGVRVGLVRGWFRMDDFDRGGAELHPTWDAMLAAHPPRLKATP